MSLENEGWNPRLHFGGFTFQFPESMHGPNSPMLLLRSSPGSLVDIYQFVFAGCMVVKELGILDQLESQEDLHVVQVDSDHTDAILAAPSAHDASQSGTRDLAEKIPVGALDTENEMTMVEQVPQLPQTHGRQDLRDDTRGFKMIATNWLTTCQSRHQCGAEQDPNWSPWRLLCILDNEVRLIVCDEDIQPRPYVALSHCWGGVKPLILEKSSLGRFKKGLYMEDLPANFRDAVFITAELRFRYLWIDSLCIIQDSKEDWLLHAAQRAFVYSNCVLNIASRSAENTLESCFAIRDSRLIQVASVFWHGFSS